MRTAAQTNRLQRLMDLARERGLWNSPPYATSRQRDCWEEGYATALRDIAEGKLPVTPLDDEQESTLVDKSD